jgi:hypothetical protein
MPKPINIYVVVTNSPIAVPRDPMIERTVVGAGMDKADNWIAKRACYKPKLTFIPHWGTIRLCFAARYR